MPGQRSGGAAVRDDSTPSRLLDATERLIGRHGVDGVSVRAINAEADSNVAAAHYHFGSKEALVEAALARRMEPLAARRFEMLDQLERRRRPSVSAVVETLVGPLAAVASTDEGRGYVRFLAALDRSGDPWRHLLSSAFAPQWARLEPILARSLPGVPDDLRRFRFSIAATTLLDVLADPERHLAGPVLAGAGLAPALIDIIVGALVGPPTGGTCP